MQMALRGRSHTEDCKFNTGFCNTTVTIPTIRNHSVASLHEMALYTVVIHIKAVKFKNFALRLSIAFK